MNKIIRTAHPESLARMMAWQDDAIVTGQALMERPYWYVNMETGQLYYDLYGVIGWPTEVTDKTNGLPGYAAVVGVVKGKASTKPVKDAAFQLLEELETNDVPTLLDRVVELRANYGHGTCAGLLQTFWGNPDRFITTLALLNEKLMVHRGAIDAILISPPNDFYELNSFDHYVRSMRSVLVAEKVRFYFGKNEILRSRLKEFRKDDPAVVAVGGLVHTLLSQTMWMDSVKSNIFVAKGEEDADD